jgi:hypothetical protein
MTTTINFQDAEGALSRPLPDATEWHAYLLHAGYGGMPMVRIEPDAQSPGMWRMVWPDNRPSDIGNLTQIRDTATAICERGPPARDRGSFRWSRIYRNLPAIRN